MPEKQPHRSAAEDGLDELFAEYLQAAETGEAVNRQEYVDRHPAFAEVIAAHEGFDRMAAPVRGIMADAQVNDADEHLDAAFAAYMEAVEDGQAPVSEAFLARYPKLANAVAAHEGLDRLAAPVRDVMSTMAVADGPGEPTLPPGTVIGDFELLEEVGRGGMGVVYKARNRKFNMAVALKMISSGPRPSEEQRRRFLAEVENQAKLHHPNIVSVSGGGEYEGQLYFTMKLIEGGDLRELVTDGPVSPLEAVQLVTAIARAVHHAHQRNILHRDLKPSNVLLDAEGKPYVADLGLAKLITDEDPIDSGYMVGAPTFVAPEQITGQATTLSDVYGLGTILYWLLTGQGPFDAELSAQEVFHKVREENPAPPHARNSQLKHWNNRYLELICLNCLAKDPGQRYQSADGLAIDLQRWLDHKPPLGVPVRRVDRLRWLCVRHPAAVGLTITALVLLMLVATAAISVAKVREVRLREQVLNGNTSHARFVAGTVLLQLREWANAVVEVSEDPEFRELLQKAVDDGALHNRIRQAADDPQKRERLRQQEHIAALQVFLEEEVAAKYGNPETGVTQPGEEASLYNWFVLNTDGIELADSHSVNENVVFEDFSLRNHFTAARAYGDEGLRGRDSIHIARVYKAKSETLFKLGICAPVYDSDELDARVLGVVTTTVTTSATLGSFQLDDGRRWLALVARGDLGPRHKGAPPDHGLAYVVLLHPAYSDGIIPVEFPEGNKLPNVRQAGPELGLPNPEQEQAFAEDDNYRDPVAELYPNCGGRWLAGFAPVGNTELWVIVQQKYDTAVEPFLNLAWTLMLWFGVGVALVLLLIGAAAFFWIRRAQDWRTA